MSKTNPGASIVASLIPHGSEGVEIGVWAGDSSVEFLAHADRLHLVDPWPGRDEQYQAVKARFADDPRVRVHRMTAERFFETFESKVDWVYVDGLHDYDSVMRDLDGAYRIIKRGGVIYGDDYGKKGGVKEAVDNYCFSRGRALQLLGLSQYAIAT